MGDIVQFPVLWGQCHTICGWHCTVFYAVWSVPHSLWVTLYSFLSCEVSATQFVGDIGQFSMLYGQCHTVCGWHCTVSWAVRSVPHSLWVTLYSFLYCVVSATQFVGDIVQFCSTTNFLGEYLWTLCYLFLLIVRTGCCESGQWYVITSVCVEWMAGRFKITNLNLWKWHSLTLFFLNLFLVKHTFYRINKIWITSECFFKRGRESVCVRVCMIHVFECTAEDSSESRHVWQEEATFIDPVM